MAERRMFAKTIIDSDHFLDLPLSAQALYFHLAMQADDDGFLNNPKRIQRLVGCSPEDHRVLVEKGFLLPFPSGVEAIRHWKIHNYIQKDRYRPTLCQQEKEQLQLEASGAYAIAAMDTGCIQDVSLLDTQARIGKGQDRINKESISCPPHGDRPPHPRREPFVKPTVDMVRSYCTERQNGVDAQRFVDYYAANGWKVGRNPMKDWKASVRRWENHSQSPSLGPNRCPTAADYEGGIL